MHIDALLQTHAEVAIALAGFASVVAALNRPLSPYARQRFLSLLALAVIQVLGCLLPLWWLAVTERPEIAWRVLSFLLLALNAARLWWLVVLPSRRLDAEQRLIINPLVNKLIWTAGTLSLPTFLLNGIGVPFPPNFQAYYAALLVTLLIGFALFADVAAEKLPTRATDT